MRMPSSTLLVAVSCAGTVLPVCRAQHTLPPVLTSCVSKLYGASRIVPSPSHCQTQYETAVQWNQAGVVGAPGAAGAAGPAGPSGPTGPQGPQGTPGVGGGSLVASLHIVLVPASGTAVQNGQALAATVARIGPLSSSQQPYLIVLDAGSFTLGEHRLAIPPYVSVRGAGMYATSLEGAFQFIGPVGQAMSFTVSDMTIQGPDLSIMAADVGNVLIENVSTDAFLSLENNFGGGNVMIRNSVLAFGVAFTATTNSAHFTVVGSQVSSFRAPGGANLLCLASYNSNFVPYSSNCQ